jgi:hypothetical protein
MRFTVKKASPSAWATAILQSFVAESTHCAGPTRCLQDTSIYSPESALAKVIQGKKLSMNWNTLHNTDRFLQVTDESAIFCFHSFPRSSFLQRARRWIKTPMLTPHRVFPVKPMWNHLAFSLANAQRADSVRSKSRLNDAADIARPTAGRAAGLSLRACLEGP